MKKSQGSPASRVKEWGLEDDVKKLESPLYTSPALTSWMYRLRRDGKSFKMPLTTRV